MTDDLSQVQRRNREQYASVAAAYARSESHAGGEDLDWFVSRARSVTPATALDVACGGGFSTRALADAGHRVLATDLTPESVAAARAAVAGRRIAWASAAAESLPVREASIGLVGCRIAAHHFADPARFVDEVVRVLAPGGLLLLVDTVAPEDDELARWLDEVERLRDPSHVRARSVSWWRAVCSGARLRVEEIRTTRKRHAMDAWLARSGCTGAAAEEVRRRFREAPRAARVVFDVEIGEDGAVAAYTDHKLCLRAVKPA